MERVFHATLEAIHDSPEQRALRVADANARLKSLGVAIVFGILVASATVAYLVTLPWWVTLVLSVGAIGALLAWDKLATSAMRIAKEQDRRYFLACLRSARSIEDLNRAGLFAFLAASQAREFVAAVQGEVAKLKVALEQRPDWFDGN